MPRRADWGGQELPHALNAACIEMWNSASMAFGIGPVLTMAAIDALHAYGSEQLKQEYLGKLVSGEWMGTMQLTEPQAGSDVGALRSKAERAGDGSYRITGSKIFITYGEHDLTDNIIHFVLARLPDAPPGTKGISLFLVPKILPDGSRNDVRAHSVEHKLGIHASPTCTMVYGDHGGAIGFLIGEENKGMACMFTMMNRARLAVGLQGVGIAERATQQALAYARERKQGAGRRDHRLPGRQTHAAHHAHPDRRRARDLLCDRNCHRPIAARENRRRAQERTRARLVADACRQGFFDRHRFGGRFPRHTGARRNGLHRGNRRSAALPRRAHRRDLRRHKRDPGPRPRHAKSALAGGKTVDIYIEELRHTVRSVQSSNAPELGETATRLGEAVDSLERATRWLLAQEASDAALAGATPYLRLFGNTAGGCMLAEDALASLRAGDGSARSVLARYFAENIAIQAGSFERSVTEGAGSITDANAALAE